MVELEFEPLSAWSLTVPTFQNILSVLAINLNRFWGGRERGGMKGGSSEVERKWQGPGMQAFRPVGKSDGFVNVQ